MPPRNEELAPEEVAEESKPLCPSCEKEEDDCHCCICTECDSKVDTDSDNFCSECDRCESCDTCWYCSTCDENHPEDTQKCSLCENRGKSICESECDYHFTCADCGERRCSDNSCSDCGYCDSCCNCVRCRECGDTDAEICDNCNQCSRHCDGDDDCTFSTAVPLRSGVFKRFTPSGRHELRHNPLNRLIGLEIEVDEFTDAYDNGRLERALQQWGDAVVEDGSLSGSRAFEINANPTAGDLLLHHVRDLTDGLGDMGATASESAGLHVHVDCSDLHTYELRKVLALYTKVERALFDLCAPRRLTGTYSIPCADEYQIHATNPVDFRHTLVSRIYNGGQKFNPKSKYCEVREEKGNKHHETRYRALNMHSFFYRKTIEFRHHEGVTDYSTILNWGLLCGWFIESAVRLSMDKITRMPLNTQDENLLSILPPSIQKWAEQTLADNWSDLTTYQRYSRNQLWSRNFERVIQCVE